MPFDPASFAISAGTSILGPLVGKGLGAMFGLDEPSERERAAREGLQRLASGRVATPAQLMLQQQKNNTLKSLQSLASRGTAQQQAGNVRAAMQAAPGIQQQQAGQLAALRAQEMQQAQSALSQLEQQQGSQDRKYMQGLIGAGVSGAASAGALAMTESPEVAKKAVAPVSGAVVLPAAAPVTAATATAQAARPVAGAVAQVANPQAVKLALGQTAASAALPVTGRLSTSATGFNDGMGIRLRRSRPLGGY